MTAVAGCYYKFRRRVILMTIGTADVLLVGTARRFKCSGYLSVAISTVVAVGCAGKDRRHRHMMAVTGRTIGLDHLLIVALMTLQAVRLVFMLNVTLVTTHLVMRGI
jgi:hypothetical protein